MSASAFVHVRRLAAATLTVAAVAGAAALPASAADRTSHRATVEISNVQHNFPGRETRSNRSLNSEWVEVSNTARRSVNLDGWTLSDRDGHTYTFHHYRLDGRSSVRVHSGIGRDTSGDIYQDRRARVWDTRSDTATLRDEDGRFVDAVSWGGRGRSDRHGELGGRPGGEHNDRRNGGGRYEAGGRHGDAGGRHGDAGGRHDNGDGRRDGRR